MGISIQILRDAKKVDASPLLEFLEWAKEHDNDIAFGCHYQWNDSQSDIIDLDVLHGELDAFFADADSVKTMLPNPPDIRSWLKKQVQAGNSLAWVGW